MTPPWPHRISNVTNHALIRYLARVRGVDVHGAKRWLKAQQASTEPAMVLSLLEARGIEVESIRKAVLAEVTEHRRCAEPWEEGQFLIHGKTGRFVVNAKDGWVVTSYELRP
jgi:hypothetical protein